MENTVLGEQMRFAVSEWGPMPVAGSPAGSLNLAETLSACPRWTRQSLIAVWVLAMQSISQGVTTADAVRALMYGWMTDPVKLVLRHAQFGELTDGEVAAYFLGCLAKKMDPWGNDAYPIVKVDRDGGAAQIVVGTRRYKMMAVAMESKEWVGLEAPVHTKTPNGDPDTTTVTVVREINGKDRRFSATCDYAEYCPADLVDPEDMWLKMPKVCMETVTEAAALRKAFPELCGQLYAREEFSRDRSRGGRGGSARQRTPPPRTDHRADQPFPDDDGQQEDQDGPATLEQLHAALIDIGFKSDHIRNEIIKTVRIGTFKLFQTNPRRFCGMVIDLAKKDPQRWGNATD